MKAIRMNLPRRYSVSITISFIIHLIILNLISFQILKDMWSIPEEISLRIINEPLSSRRDIRKNNLKKPVKKQIIDESSKKIDDIGSSAIKRPNVILPEMNLDEKIAVKSPDFTSETSNVVKNMREGGVNLNAVEAELDRFADEYVSKSGTGVANEISMGSDFFEFRNISNKSRRIVFIPETREKFKLEKNTDLILSFYINRDGTPYNISFITRSLSEIEGIALNFVKAIRFEAVSYINIDRAEIVLHFKVH